MLGDSSSVGAARFHFWCLGESRFPVSTFALTEDYPSHGLCSVMRTVLLVLTSNYSSNGGESHFGLLM